MSHRPDWPSLVVVALFAGIAGLVAGASEPLRRTRAAALGLEGVVELEALEARFGAERQSRFAEEWIIRDFFNDRRGGVFLDVGANDYRIENNTFFLETALGWSGIAVDAQGRFAEGYRLHRPRTRFFALFVSETSDSTIDFYVPNANHGHATSQRALIPQHGDDVETQHVPTITLNDLLERQGVTSIDFLNMDIEFAEPPALAGFDIERYQPALVCIEGHREIRQQLLDYFDDHDYRLLGKYLRMDTQNLYFAPRVSTN